MTKTMANNIKYRIADRVIGCNNSLVYFNISLIFGSLGQFFSLLVSWSSVIKLSTQNIENDIMALFLQLCVCVWVRACLYMCVFTVTLCPSKLIEASDSNILTLCLRRSLLHVALWPIWWDSNDRLYQPYTLPLSRTTRIWWREMEAARANANGQRRTIFNIVNCLSISIPGREEGKEERGGRVAGERTEEDKFGCHFSE